ncbi:ATP-binding protein [Novosphingobium sp. FSW06-99]|uniref:ATP-binding protein n=1 Tax=Novosphingobium sp. FSW06-99 TaxID=1739113 RepID=UPI00076CEC18|nr:ATP-binding protein [Novosphingobium sp. FSW06-99]KUR72069.1 hypothetical protein AQZ49_20495 [Novosphingobium sp. FSW06-99]
MRTEQAATADNLRFIAAEFDWLDAAIAARFAAFGQDKPLRRAVELPPPPPLIDRSAAYPALIHALGLNDVDRLVLALAAAPSLAPERLDPFLLTNAATGRGFTEFGGATGQAHRGFLPTLATAQFLAFGGALSAPDPLALLHHALLARGVLTVDPGDPRDPALSGVLRLSLRGLQTLVYGEQVEHQPNVDFPASAITTPLDWSDLILDAPTMRQIEMVGRWLEHGDTLMREWGLARRLKPGYRCLFHGPPGTGKTLTACLLGKHYGLPVYRVDLSRVVSKWIGETEKNLAALFDEATDRNWILFFDEADALFGKRTESRSANDRAANQQIAYLLQRLETHPGVAILATNQSAHLDEAFARRFQTTIQFAMPDAPARLRLWQESFANPGFALAADVDFASLARAHELAGGAIINVLRHAALLAVGRQPATVIQADLIDGIRLELLKNGRYFG